MSPLFTTRRLVWMGMLSSAALMAWWLMPTEPAPKAAGTEGAFPWARTPEPSLLMAVAPRPAAPSVLTTAAPLSAVPSPRGAAVFDICGLGRVSATPSDAHDAAAGGLDALPAPVGREPLGGARERLLAGLRQGNPQQQLAALLLTRPDAEQVAAVAQWAQQVLQLAMSSRQAVMLAWAEEACGFVPDGSACRLGQIRARIALEPDNGHHWAALADEDPSAGDEAWRGLQQARRWHESPQALMATVQAAVPPDLPAYLKQAVVVQALGQAGTLPSPGEGFLQTRCPASREGGSNGQSALPGECSAVAQLLVEHSDGTQTLALGAQLAQAAAWPAERVRAVQAELRALASPAARWQPDASQPLSCASVEAWQQQAATIGRSGELASLRARLAQAQSQPAPR